MFKIGIRVHDLDGAPFENIDNLIDELNQKNIKYIQLVFKKAFKDFKMDKNFLIELSKKLKENNIEVAMIGAYFNMVHPIKEKVSLGIAYFKECLVVAPVFDTLYVGSETGSLSGDKWIYHPLNKLDDTYLKAKEVIKELLDYSNNLKAKPIIEGAYNHTMYDVDRLNQVVNELDIENITFDLYNFLNIDNYKDYKEIFKKGTTIFKDKIKIFHMKDFIIQDNKLVQVGIGDGYLDFNYILNIIKNDFKDCYLILEGVTKENIKRSIEFIRKFE